MTRPSHDSERTAEQPQARPRKRSRRLLRVLCMALLAILAVAAVLPLAVETAAGTRWISAWLSKRAQQAVSIESIEVGYWRPGFTARGVVLGDFLKVQTVTVQLDAAALVERRLDGHALLAGLEIDFGKLGRAQSATKERPPRPGGGATALPLGWELGTFSLVVHATSPEFDVTLEHRPDHFKLDADLREIGSFVGAPFTRVSGQSISGQIQMPGNPLNAAEWSGELQVQPATGSASLLESGGVVVRDLVLAVRLANGQISVERAEALVDGRQLSVKEAVLSEDRLRIDAGVDGNLTALADFTGVPLASLLAGELSLADPADLRRVLAALQGTATATLQEQKFRGHKVSDVALSMSARDGLFTVERLEGVADGARLTATARVDVNPMVPVVDIEVTSASLVVLDVISSASAEGLRLKARVLGLPPWTPEDDIQVTGRLHLDTASVAEQRATDVGLDFALRGASLQLTAIEAVVLDQYRVSGEATVDLRQGPESASARIVLEHIALPLFGEARAVATMRLVGESTLVLDPVEVTLGAGALRESEETMIGSASYDLRAQGAIPFQLRAARLTIDTALPPLEGFTASGALSDAVERTGRARFRVERWEHPSGGLTELTGEVAFDHSGVRADLLEGRLDGSPFTGQGDLQLLTGAGEAADGTPPGVPWQAHAGLRVDAWKRDAISVAGVDVKARVQGRGFTAAGLAQGTLDLVVASASVDEHKIEALAASATIDSGRFSIVGGSIRFDEQLLEFDASIDLLAEAHPTTLEARAAQLQVGNAEFDAAVAHVQLTRLADITDVQKSGASGLLGAARASFSGVELAQVNAPFAFAGGEIQARGVTFKLRGQPGSADLQIDTVARPMMGVSGTLRFPRITLGTYDLSDVELVGSLYDDSFAVRSLSASYGNFTVKGGGRFGLPGEGSGAGHSWIDATLALEHPELRGMTVTTKLRGLALQQRAQPTLSGSIDIRVREADVLGDTLTELRASAVAVDGVFTSSELSAKWGTGTISGAGSFSAAVDEPTYDLAVSASRIPLERGMGHSLGFALPIFSGGESKISGVVEAQISLTGRGLTRADLDKHLTGSGSAELRDGLIAGSPLLGIFEDWHGLRGETQVTADTAFQVAGGKVHTTRDLVLRSNQDLMTMSGWVDFDRRIQYAGKIKALAPLQPLFEPYVVALARDGMVPFQVTGTLDSPQYGGPPPEAMVGKVIEILTDPSVLKKIFGDGK